MDAKYLELNNDDDEIYLIDNATTHTIFKHERSFSYLDMGNTNVNTIYGSAKLIEYSKKTLYLSLKEL